MKVLGEPSVVKVSLFLCLGSIGLGIILTALEYMIGKELSGTSTLSTILPALITGIFWGNKSGKLMPSKIRWYSLLVWLAISLFFGVVISLLLNVSLYSLAVEFGWFNLIFIALFSLLFLLTYHAMKSGEKIGVKSYLKKKGINEVKDNNTGDINLHKATFFIKENVIHMLLAIMFTLIFLFLYFYLLIAVSEFSKVQDMFGTEMPVLTQFLYNHYMWLSIFFVLTILSFLAYFISVVFYGVRKKVFWKAVKINSAICVVVFVSVFITVYLPVFSNGDVIG
ncbi:hypothetical protein [Psychromonas aquimarina]|uniref:hypothetical protein n=1 Tax=Psychromonas aquimarina TaxID=444919 RepID=UPI00040782F9|nr:hypothetical protein [Psychromonas aquimarina]